MLLSVAQVAKTYGPSRSLTDISFVIYDGEHVGLVGANGAGKSTLFRIITGEIESDTGRVTLASGAIAGYLPQQPPEPDGASVDDLVYEAVGELRQMEARLRELEACMAAPDDDFETLLAEYGDVQERFDRRGGYDLDHRIDLVFAGLGVGHIARDREFVTLSGGEKTRILLAALLLRSPDLLLLDEPTNHLDFGAISWLEEYLASYRGTILAISHDRQFLNRTVTRIIEIDDRTRVAKEYAGNYDAYAATRDREMAQWEADYNAQQEEIRELKRAIRVSAREVAPNRKPRDPDKMAYDFKGARVDTAIARNVHAAAERLRRIETDPVLKPPTELRILPEFDSDTLRSEDTLTVSRLSKSFGSVRVLDNVTFTVGPGERVVIVGPNGAGKSTLMNIVMGRETADSGTVRLAQSARPGYLDQDGSTLDERLTVLDAFRAGLPGHEQDFINELFRYGLFQHDDLSKLVGQISAGQRRKLQIARLIAEQSNLLLLDEPTNHLSFDILEKFEHALRVFPGPILAVSHDRWFIERFNGHVWELRNGQIVRHEDEPARVLAGLMETGPFRPTPSS
jgi:macrolide transport system ATP-binding/permease protein